MTKKLISEIEISFDLYKETIEKLKRDLAFKREELQAMYLEHKTLSKKVDALEKENYSLKQQVKQLEQEAEEMLLYP